MVDADAHIPDFDEETGSPKHELLEDLEVIDVEFQEVKEAPKPPEDPCLYDLLSEDQLSAWDAIEEALGQSHALRMFHLSGDAGTGKSFLIAALTQKYGRDKVALMAPTGIAAQNISGSTIHSFFGLFPFKLFRSLPDHLEKGMTPEQLCKFKYAPHNIKYNRGLADKNMKGVRLVIIDEISMVSAGMLECLVWILKGYNPVVLFVGDFLQLPPVRRRHDNRNRDEKARQEQLPEKFGTKAFWSPLWYEVKNLHLTLNHRQQTDNLFLKALNHLRYGAFTPELSQILRERNFAYLPDWAPMLMSTRAAVSKANNERLHALGNEIVESDADYIPFEDWSEEEMREGDEVSDSVAHKLLKEHRRIPQNLEFAVGARIVMLTNTGEWVNGSTGEIIGIHESTSRLKELQGTIVRIRLDNGRECSCTKHQHQIHNSKGKVIVRYTQYPFQLAWALTIHKCQGMTMDRVGIDLSKQFETGMTYVAISRCKSKEGLYFTNLHRFYNILVDKMALQMEIRRVHGMEPLPPEYRPKNPFKVLEPADMSELDTIEETLAPKEPLPEDIDDIPF